MRDDDRISRNIELHSIVRDMSPWTPKKEHDDLDIDPNRASSVSEVIWRWMASRVTIFDVGLGQLRWGMTDREVDHLAEHVEKYLAIQEGSHGSEPCGDELWESE